MNTSPQQDKIPYRNEQVKREFFTHLRGAKGFTEDSINDYADSLGQWQIFTDNEDFAAFNSERAGAFCNWLAKRTTKTKEGKLKLATRYHYLRRIKEFFAWLADRPGYREKIDKGDVEFLRLPKNDMHVVRAGTTKPMPTLEEVHQVIESIEPSTEINQRDRALISFALITGCRISAIISLRMKSFDKERMEIYQSPAEGVRTKNSKTIKSTFYPIGWYDPERYFIEWYEYLQKKGFGPDDPIFPATSSEINGENAHSKENISRKFWSVTSSARKIFEKRCKNASVRYYHPHSYRHLVVSILSKKRLTEEEKRAISLTLGHSDVATTFGSYGYGAMTEERAVDIVRELKRFESTDGMLEIPDEVRAFLKRLLDK